MWYFFAKLSSVLYISKYSKLKINFKNKIRLLYKIRILKWQLLADKTLKGSKFVLVCFLTIVLHDIKPLEFNSLNNRHLLSCAWVCRSAVSQWIVIGSARWLWFRLEGGPRPAPGVLILELQQEQLPGSWFSSGWSLESKSQAKPLSHI